MKKLFAILMSIMMIACFMPSMAFAEGAATPQNIKLGNGEQSLTMLEKTYGDTIEDIPISVTKTNDGPVSNGGALSATVSEQGTDVIGATIDGSNLKLTIKKAGTATVTVKAEGTENYAAGTAELTVTVAPKELTGIDVSKVTVTKVYNGEKTAGNVSGDISFTGRVKDDNVSITAVASDYEEADKYVGENKTVTLTFSLAGDKRANYVIASGSETAKYTKAAITAATQEIQQKSAGLKIGKTLDLSTTFTSNAEGANLIFTVDENSKGTVSLDKDGKTLKGLAAGTATITVTADAVDVGGDEKPEYAALAENTTVTVNVTAKDTIDDSKIKFDNQNVTYGNDYTPNVATLTEEVGEEGGDWSYTYKGKDGTTTTYEESTTPPTNAGTYTVTAKYESENKVGTATADLTIAKKALTIQGVKVANKVYDGTDAATIKGTPTLNAEDIVAGDAEQLQLNATDATATFADVNAGKDKTVNVSGYILTGTAAANYTLQQPTEVTAAINKAPLRIKTATVAEKPYDGETTATVSKVEFDGLVTVGETTETLTPTTDYGVVAYFLDGPDVGTNKDVIVEVTLKPEGSVVKNYVLDGDAIDAKGNIKRATKNPAPTAEVTVQKGTYGFVDIHSAIEADGVIGEISVTEGKDTYFDADKKPSVNEKGLLEFTLSGTASDTVVITVPVENARNYENYDIKVTVTVSDAEQVNVSAPRALDRVYDGTTKPLVEAGVTSAGTMQYSSTENGEYTEAIPEAKDANDSYTVYYKVVKNEADVSNARGSVTVKIEKAPVTVQPKSFTIKQGDKLPTLVLKYVGLLGEDELTVGKDYQPEFKYMQGENDVTGEPKEVGTYTIKWTNASEGSFTNTNYEVMKEDTATLTIEAKAPYGGGSYYPYTPSTPSKPAAPGLDKTKTDSAAALNAAATANKYDAAEQAEVKKILDKANADIKNAKTEAEVKAIEEAAQAEIDKILTTEEKAIVAALDNVEKRDFATKSKVITRKGGKKVIRLTWTAPDGVDVDGYEIFRSTKKNSGFGKKPYFTTSNTSYTNTKDLKAGKTYYYKVRAFVVINGERVYTDYSLKAYRKL